MGTTVRLSDGRVLGMERLGSPGETPVLFFHGLPGSRLDFLSESRACARAGVELIALDRPGFGVSSPQPGRVPLDWARDVAELADVLGLGRFAVLGYSAGAKYALACAYALPERIAAAGVLAGSAPPETPGWDEGMIAAERAAQWASLHAPLLARAGWSALGALARRLPGPVMEGFARGLGGPDRRLIGDPDVREALLLTLLEGLRQGGAAIVEDYAIEGRAWGFDLARIEVPVLLWHGDQDDDVPLAHAHWLAERIPGASLEMVAGAGHLMIGRLGTVAAGLRAAGSTTQRTA
jgi:pimeloyl-ACP methyl ester carboxylesterase